MTSSKIASGGSLLVLTLGILLAGTGPAHAQLGAAGYWGPYGPYGAGYLIGPYGWGPYAYGWAGQMLPPQELGMEPPIDPVLQRQAALWNLNRARAQSEQTAESQEATALLQKQAQAIEMERQGQAPMRAPIEEETKPEREPRSQSLDERLSSLLDASGEPRWPLVSSRDPDLNPRRTRAEQAIRRAYQSYRVQGHADMETLAAARQSLTSYGSALLRRLSIRQDWESHDTLQEYFRELNQTLGELVEQPEAPAGQPDEPS